MKLRIANLQLGEKRQALDALQLGAALHEPPMIFLKVEPVFGPLRGNANFQALERRIGLQP